MADAVNKVRADYTADKQSGPRRRSRIKYFVIHTAEADLPESGAEAIGRYFSGKSSRGSSHYGVDINSTQRYLKDLIIAWGAPPLNVSGLHVECAGKAGFTRKKWLTTYAPMFRRLGWLVQNRCKRNNIPLNLLTVEELRKKGTDPKVGGITTHARINDVWTDSDHWDPGPNFPLDVMMAWTHFYAQGWAKAQVSRPVLHIYNEGKRVKRLQTDLTVAGFYKGECDGVFGKATETAVKKLQKHANLEPNGVVGLRTWKALDRVS